MVLLFPFLLMLILGFTLLMLASYWKLFEKAGREGWEGILPLYNLYVILGLIGRPTYWLLLLFIPFLNIFISIRMLDLFVKRFGKDEIYTIGCLFLPFIFIPALAFSDAEFQPVETYEWDEGTPPSDSDFV